MLLQLRWRPNLLCRIAHKTNPLPVMRTQALATHSLEGFKQRVAECNAGLDLLSSLVPLQVTCNETPPALAGYVTPSFAQLLVQFRDVFQVELQMEMTGSNTPISISLQSTLDTPEKRTVAMAGVTQALRAAGQVPGWRDELYPVVATFDSKPFFLIERAAAVCFGTKAYGVHVNGYVETPDGLELWVARRSKAKQTFPGRLDHMVAGGLPHGISPWENMIKECVEEANIPPELAEAATAAGAVSYQTITSQGLKRDVLFVYDLPLPMDFVPQPADGEVESFERLPLSKVADIISSSREYKDNCNLVIIDFLVRRGFLRPEQHGYLQLLAALRSGDCS